MSGIDTRSVRNGVCLLFQPLYTFLLSLFVVAFITIFIVVVVCVDIGFIYFVCLFFCPFLKTLHMLQYVSVTHESTRIDWSSFEHHCLWIGNGIDIIFIKEYIPWGGEKNDCDRENKTNNKKEKNRTYYGGIRSLTKESVKEISSAREWK